MSDDRAVLNQFGLLLHRHLSAYYALQQPVFVPKHERQWRTEWGRAAMPPGAGRRGPRVLQETSKRVRLSDEERERRRNEIRGPLARQYDVCARLLPMIESGALPGVFPFEHEPEHAFMTRYLPTATPFVGRVGPAVQRFHVLVKAGGLHPAYDPFAPGSRFPLSAVRSHVEVSLAQALASEVAAERTTPAHERRWAALLEISDLVSRTELATAAWGAFKRLEQGGEALRVPGHGPYKCEQERHVLASLDGSVESFDPRERPYDVASAPPIIHEPVKRILLVLAAHSDPRFALDQLPPADDDLDRIAAILSVPERRTAFAAALARTASEVSHPGAPQAFGRVVIKHCRDVVSSGAPGFRELDERDRHLIGNALEVMAPELPGRRPRSRMEHRLTRWLQGD